MSRAGRITLAFGDGPHDFALTIEGLEELQEKTDHGPEEVYRMLGDGTWKGPKFIREPLRIGLVGAGMSPLSAAVLVERYAGPGELAQWKRTAQAVIIAALVGAPDEDETTSGEGEGETAAPLSPEEKSASETSTAAAE
jgi:hypothetical protein